MRRRISPLRRFKYRILQHLPGQRGWHYKRKLRLADYGATEAAFAAAIEGAAGRICVDLGANLGVFSQRMAAHAGKVYAFEPDPWTAEELRKAVADLPNVEVIEAAAGAEDGT
ncbi:MAG: FkbM family methyltransferase, partial [Paracoccaceae bacterium]